MALICLCFTYWKLYKLSVCRSLILLISFGWCASDMVWLEREQLILWPGPVLKLVACPCRTHMALFKQLVVKILHECTNLIVCFYKQARNKTLPYLGNVLRIKSFYSPSKSPILLLCWNPLITRESMYCLACSYSFE